MREPSKTEMEVTKAAVNATDEELAVRAVAGSRPAFEELVSRYSLRLFHFLRSRSGSDEDVEDLVQETFLKAYRNIGRYDPQRKFSTWLFTVAIRLSISRHRSQRAKPLPLDSEWPEHPSPRPQEALIREEEAQRAGNIWLLARTLKPSEYEVLWLRYAEEMPMKEIARATKRSLVGVRVLLHRSRLKLGKKLRVPSPAAGLAEAAAAQQRLSIL
jgi:RNA polymerase sigma-70 factor (ECF subfamily)